MAVVALLVLGAGAVGLAVGAAGVYAIVGRQDTRSAVPVSKGYAREHYEAESGGWRKYTFPDLDLAVDLPGPVQPHSRSFPARSAAQIVEADDYSGGNSRIGIIVGAYWDRFQDYDLSSVVDYNIKNRSAPGIRYTSKQEHLAGVEAIEVRGSYGESGAPYDFESLFLKRGNGFYYLQVWYRDKDKEGKEDDWARLRDSIAFLGKAPILR